MLPDKNKGQNKLDAENQTPAENIETIETVEPVDPAPVDTVPAAGPEPAAPEPARRGNNPWVMLVLGL
ncbi:MAG: hypothetical protein D6768_13770, partial [Chloroflexi bacterium]